MGRRRKKTSPVEDLLELPWQASVVCGVAAFVVLRWVVPSFLATHPILSALAGLAVSFSGLALCGFCFIGLLSFLRARFNRANSSGAGVLKDRGGKRKAPVSFTPAWSRAGAVHGMTPQAVPGSAGAAPLRLD